MKLIVCRVYYHTITEKDGKEVARAVQVAVIAAAETTAQLIDTLPTPHTTMEGATIHNVITQIHQIHKDVLYMPGIRTQAAKG